MSAVEMNNDQSEFRCPGCGACKWDAELWLPGGLMVTCGSCGWKSKVSEIEKTLAIKKSLAARQRPSFLDRDS